MLHAMSSQSGSTISPRYNEHFEFICTIQFILFYFNLQPAIFNVEEEVAFIDRMAEDKRIVAIGTTSI